MNLQNLNFDHVEAPPNHLTENPALASSTIRQQSRQSGHQAHGSSTHQSLATQPTGAPQRPSVHSHSHSHSTSTTSDLYGPDRLFANLPLQQPAGYHAARPSDSSAHFDEAQLAMFAADNAARMASIKDELTIAAGKVTPGVDDTPYIQYALEALVGRHGGSVPRHLVSGSSGAAPERYQQLPRRVADEGMGYPQVAQPGFTHVHDPPAQTDRPIQTPRVTTPPQPPRPTSAYLDPNIQTSDRWVPVTKDMLQSIDPRGRTYQPLTFKPRILRPFSMIILMTFCLLMTAALIFSARYSYEHSGLTPYPGSIYSGQYFLFRILPQLLAAIIFIFAQSIVSASLRVLPFTSLANEDPRERYMALFQKLYAVSFLLPQLVGPWQLKVFGVATWLAIFTIPLQSSAFTCIYFHEHWIWAPVQGVVWALVALYIMLFLATAILMVYWFGQWTGLVWDVRSIGDLLPLLNRSNGTETYGRSELAENRSHFKDQLRERWFDRLGYWRTEDMITGGIWYTIGASGTEQEPKVTTEMIDRKTSNDPSFDSRDIAPVSTFDRARGKYLPWSLRDGPMLGFVAVTTLLLLAFLVISFLPQTRIDSGFFPGLTAKPDESAFSAANFVFSFVPSFLGMILFLCFQSIDLTLRTLQPWADLYHVSGSPARRSLLADYAACLPLQSTWRAARHGHWRVAVISLLATLFVFIPVLAGGLFMALTSPDDQVRMYPSMPVFGVLLACLFLYVGGLSLMVPHRRQFLLPRPVTSIADIISFCSATELTQDAAFRSVRGRDDLEGRLGATRADSRDESMWFFGIVPGKDEHRMSVRRMNRFTEKKPRSIRSMV